MKNTIFLFSMLLALFLFSGCASKKSQSTVNTNQNEMIENSNIVMSHNEIEDEDFLDEFEEEMEIEEKSDPFSGYNKVMTSFNDGLFTYVLTPVSKGYKAVVHKEIRNSVGNFFHNILYPIRLVNNLLQGKLSNSGEETSRFVINSTVGILGLFDPAKSYFGLESHEEDFGQTLGFYGVGSGPHIVLPFLGPSNLRDMISLYPDSLINPIDYDSNRKYNISSSSTNSIFIKAYDRINYVSLHEGEYETLKKDAVDLYPYLRDVYEQYREQKIKE